MDVIPNLKGTWYGYKSFDIDLSEKFVTVEERMADLEECQE